MSKRRHFTSEQKLAIVREHLLEKVPVSELVDKHQIHAVQFYQWQKRLFEEGASVFDRKTNNANQRRQQDAQTRKIEQLEGQLQAKNNVMAELLQEHVTLKKELGEP